jgi:uncharacterized protein with GYD domain
MKHQDQLSFVTDDQAEQMGADMAIQFMLMTLFQMVSETEMADDPRGFRSDVHKELTDLVATYKLPPMPEATVHKIRASAGKILDGILMRSFEQARQVKYHDRRERTPRCAIYIRSQPTRRRSPPCSGA